MLELAEWLGLDGGAAAARRSDGPCFEAPGSGRGFGGTLAAPSDAGEVVRDRTHLLEVERRDTLRMQLREGRPATVHRVIHLPHEVGVVLAR